MKLLHLTTSGEMGGAETSLVALLESVREAEPGWDLTVVAPAEGRLLDRLRQAGIRARVLPFPPALARVGEPAPSPGGQGMAARGAAALGTLAYVRALARLLRDERPSVVHAHGFKMHVMAALARPSGAAVIWHVHGYLSDRPWTARVLRALRSRAAAVIANSRSVEQDLRHQFGGSTLIQTLYNAVELDRFAPDGKRLDLDAASGLPPAAPGVVRVGLVSTFARWKGHEVFLDAVAQVPAAVPIRAYVIGAPIYATAGSQLDREALRRAASAPRLDGRIGFTGFVDDPGSAMRALDIVVHASIKPEPFGMVIAEAMASGRALIASRAGGAAELFEDGVEAIGHEPGNAAELARAITTLSADPALRARLGRAARARAERQFDHRRLADALVPLYRTLSAA